MNEEQRGPGMPGPLAELVKKLSEYPRRFRQFLHEVRVELRNVSWPNREAVKSTTAVVILTVFVFGLFLFAVDSGVSRAVQWVLRYFKG